MISATNSISQRTRAHAMPAPETPPRMPARDAATGPAPPRPGAYALGGRDGAPSEATTAQPARPGAVGHVRDAIALNTHRRAVYRALSGGASAWTSTLLVLSERAVLVLAWLMDRWARRFNRRGIPIVRDDFVPMRRVRPPNAPPRHRGVASAAQRHALRQALHESKRTAMRCAWRGDLAGAAEATHRMLRCVRHAEAQWQCSFTMTAHLLESTGWGLMRGLDYARQSHGQTKRLSSFVALTQLLGLWVGGRIDRAAQRVHRLGVGIVDNDVPPIPFAERWCLRQAALGQGASSGGRAARATPP